MGEITFEQVKPLIEQMPLDERERLREWLDRSTEARDVLESAPSSWGEQLVALVNQFDLTAEDEMDIPDPEAWVRERRRTQTERRNPGWGGQ
jgi:hypothetical protein